MKHPSLLIICSKIKGSDIVFIALSIVKPLEHLILFHRDIALKCT